MRILSVVTVIVAGVLISGCMDSYTPPDAAQNHIRVTMSNNWGTEYFREWRIQADDTVFLINEDVTEGIVVHKMAQIKGAYGETLAYMQELNFAELQKICDAIPDKDKNTITDQPGESIAWVENDVHVSASVGCAGAAGVPARFDQIYEAIRVAIQDTVKDGVE